ncbi:protein NETWORKED 4A [Diospyros lotus]|uniref:protein NETWORKED 4A n=1 Tax=Diospyros lotus TaxID=55363 RepID=UPI00224F9944|nr:protein NETWORKED 4A [Diospyros lotus]XP_052192535.1 protein NETWORKED 4A [Diospyros lotus]XP_052192543.1 protein NETWORKED 4A [Diospyros lotus]XP_052192551.1 protein NETWORKED 4A [Diospyros lotus]XP_052192557.1 protein NETWORKED 4A [Diospyros lotus]XP_052192567.1 protein NETWORKED 4A [Diospyros lotus]
MASLLVKSNKNMRRTESKKSHSWWWDSHISPKNSKWLAENLEEMDQSVKRMLKLIEEDADSFAKKAEMYYQKRPELISHVEELYRMYCSLAERYDHVTGELRKNIPSDLQSQGSGISDVGSEPASILPSPDQRLSRRKSGPRAAGFDFFLGSGGSNSDLCNKEGDDSSTLDSETESDDSSINSVNNYSVTSGNSEGQGLRRKIVELEVELRDMKEKLRIQQEQNTADSSRRSRNGNSEGLLARIAGYEEEMRDARDKIRLYEEETARLKMELQSYRSGDAINNLQGGAGVTGKDVSFGANLELESKQARELGETKDGLKIEVSDPELRIQRLGEELKITKEKLQGSERESANLRHELENSRSSVRRLQDQLGLAQKDNATLKAKVEREHREVSKLQDRISRYKNNLSERDQEIRILRETISNANQSLSEENTRLQAGISKLLKERTYLEDNIKEWELRCQFLEEEVRRVKAGKVEMEEFLQAEIQQLRVSFKLELDTLIAARAELNTRITTLNTEISSRDGQIEHMDKHLKQLHMEHVELIAGAENAQTLSADLRSKVKELEEEVERQRDVIREGAEEKREAIRQLCFSLEHYRDGYHQLRQAFVGHKRHPVLAT